MYTIVFLRHGQSDWNKKNLFTGWTDVDLSSEGEEEARNAGRILKEKGFVFDLAYTSVLKRAIRTLWLCLEQMDLMWINEEKHWRLNERHYGELQGLNKAQMAERVGEDKVHIWRRSYDISPPPLKEEDQRHPKNDPKYTELSSNELPATECLKDTVERVLPYWNETIVPKIKEGKKIIITAHGNSLRALVKHIDKISDEEISELNIPTGIPLVYELDEKLNPIKHYYLADEKELQEKIEAVKKQGSK